jgi:hypothetical protein
MFDTDIESEFPAVDLDRLTADELAVWEAEPDPPAQVIPDDLAEWLPGPFLGVILSATDISRLSDYDRIVLLKARSRFIAHQQAEFYAELASIHAAVTEISPGFAIEEIFDGATAEVRAALSWTRRAAENHLGFSLDMLERLPQVWEALHAGKIDLAKARVLANETAHLEESTAQTVADTALERASQLTTGQLGAWLRLLSIAVNPEEAESRYIEAVEERRLVSEANVSGTSNLLGLDMAPHRVTAVKRRIDRIARSLKTREESRTMDQLRADVYLDLLSGKTAKKGEGGDRGVVHMTSDLKTLAKLAENPGELAGYGPVIADINRQVAQAQAKSEWRWTVTDPATGEIITGTTRRRPTAAQRRQVEAETPTCVFPGCRMPASRCDIDHNQAWADGGPTTNPNLGPFCRHDHVIRHQHGWKVKQLRPGVYQLTSRLGHIYTTTGLPP